MDLYGSVQSKRSISFDGGCCDENFCNQHDPDVSNPNPITGDQLFQKISKIAFLVSKTLNQHFDLKKSI